MPLLSHLLSIYAQSDKARRPEASSLEQLHFNWSRLHITDENLFVCCQGCVYEMPKLGQMEGPNCCCTHLAPAAKSVDHVIIAIVVIVVNIIFIIIIIIFTIIIMVLCST